MKAYARWLFGTAAVFNIVVGVGLMLARPQLEPWLQIGPISGAGQALIALAGLLVALLGWAYALIAIDPRRYRGVILIGGVGKLAAFVCIVLPWLQGAIGPAMPVLVTGDLIYAVLFLTYFVRTRSLAYE